ncbi:MAG: transglutaminase family protein, partial [Planctomycetales bacterium]|nr:transglutaminase family protein [Planctomycetales bacterium]
ALPSLAETLPQDLEKLLASPDASARVLLQRADELAEQAESLRRTASDVAVAAAVAELRQELDRGDKADLLRAALLVSRLDNRELEIAPYLAVVEQMAGEISSGLPDGADAAARRAALDHYLFAENGFHGSRTDYDHRANSYLDRVIDDREGLPITLSVLYIDLGKRLGLPLEGVGLPGHFVVRLAPAKETDEPQLIDVFDGARRMPMAEAERRIRAATGEDEVDESYLTAVTPRQIVRRMLQNLLAAARREEDQEAALRYLEAVVAIDPDDAASRGMRSIVRFQTGRRAAALADLDWFLEHEPQGIDLDQIRAMKARFEQAAP